MPAIMTSISVQILSSCSSTASKLLVDSLEALIDLLLRRVEALVNRLEALVNLLLKRFEALIDSLEMLFNRLEALVHASLQRLLSGLQTRSATR